MELQTPLTPAVDEHLRFSRRRRPLERFETRLSTRLCSPFQSGRRSTPSGSVGPIWLEEVEELGKDADSPPATLFSTASLPMRSRSHSGLLEAGV